MSVKNIFVCHLGRTPYAPMWELQRRVQQSIVNGKRSGNRKAHVLFTVEHPPVFTLGKSGDEKNLLASSDELDDIGASFVHIDRGGDITFHGPGQLVVYPILDLEQIFTDVGKYLRYLEEAVIRTCASWNISTDRFEGRTGVWVTADSHGPERKICAMGIKASRWVTMHGLALNVSTDLTYFSRIVPCGIDDRGVTSMEKELGVKPETVQIRESLITNIVDVFELEPDEVSAANLPSFLKEFGDIDGSLLSQIGLVD
ncbi:MAG: lipoyl(octanoyl) transferase LipB [Rhodothermales bacterium]|nr:lipoyl(octanoyl) transferase LipB [Rhodothermales bacterium]